MRLPSVTVPEEMKALHQALQVQRVVIVTPSVYGTDNSATLFGMNARGNDARGVAVIGSKNSDAELDAMERACIVDVRVILATGGTHPPLLSPTRASYTDAGPLERRWLDGRSRWVRKRIRPDRRATRPKAAGPRSWALSEIPTIEVAAIASG